MLCVALAGAYITVPWWVPTGWLRGYLVGEMSSQMGVGVRIGGISLSWTEGIELRDLRIDSPAGFDASAGPMVDVPVIRAELSPVNCLLRKRLAWMEIDGPQMRVEIDEEGNANVGVLKRLKFDIQPDRISVRGAAASIHTPHQKHRLVLAVRDMQLVAGRLSSLRRVTMSAELQQHQLSAPVALHLDATGPDMPVAATASFNFARVDLDQLPLVRMLGLPLRKLSGRCSGSLNLQVNRDGRVDRARCSVVVRRLHVQPLDEWLKLPVIDEAGFRISGAFDLGGRIDLQSISVRLPGIDLAGRAVVYPEAFEGNWQAIEHMEMEGVVHPTRLAAFLTGHGPLPGDVVVSGPIRAGIRLDYDGHSVRLSGHADATRAEIRRISRKGDSAGPAVASAVLKPRGRELRTQLDAVLDDRGWRLSVDRWRLVLGGNTFSGAGTLGDIRRLFALAGVDPGAAAGPGGELRDRRRARVPVHVAWQGQMVLTELESLRRLAGPAGRGAEGLALRGTITGELSVVGRKDKGAEISAWLKLPAETELSLAGAPGKEAIAPYPIKPAGREMRLFARASLGPNPPDLENVALGVTVANGHAALDNGYVRFAAGADGLEVDAKGDIEVAAVEELLAGLGALGVTGRQVRGSLTGRYVMRLCPAARRVRVWGDLTGMDVRLGRAFVKPGGKRARFDIDLLSDRRPKGAGRNVLRCEWRALHDDGRLRARVQADLAFAGGASDMRADLSAVARIMDASWLTEISPLLASAAGGGRLGGSLVVRADGAWRPGRLEADVRCDADDVAYEPARPGGRRKRAGIPLRLRLVARADRRSDTTALDLGTLAVDLGGTRLRLTGRAEVSSGKAKRPGGIIWPTGLKRLDGELTGWLAFDSALAAMFPEAGRLARRHALSGSVRLSVRLGAGDDDIGIHAEADGDKLAFRTAWDIVKPAGMPARASLAASMPRDVKHITINDLQVRVGDVHLLVGGSARLVERPDALPDVGPVDLHLALWTRRAESLRQLSKHLESWRLAGDTIIETEWTSRDGGHVPYVSWHARSLRGRYRGKEVSAGGHLLLRDIRRAADGSWRAGGLTTDGLQLRAGRNHAWLIADVSGLRDAATGSFHVLAEHLDVRDIDQWLNPAQDAGAAGADGRPKDDAAVKTARARAKGAIEAISGPMRLAKLKGVVRIGHLRTWDPAVRQYYDARELRADVSVDRGHVKVAYGAGLNGGSFRGGLAVKLTDDEPIVARWQELKDVAARENIQPQLAQYFPGNTVYGLFNRREDVEVPLVDMVANTMDYRVPLRPVGTGKTVTIDGLTQGRAAPKFVTALFPGLNLAKYRYRKMTAFTEFLPDGSASNDMIFDGHTYDIYIEGTTDAQKIGRYEIGLILVGTPQSAQWNHIWKQGRLPILKFTARIEGGKLHDVEVWYPWPNETLGVIFLKNNILYRALLAGSKK